MEFSSSQIDALNDQLKSATAAEVVVFFLEKFRGRIALSSSLGAEDQVLTDMVARADTDARVFTLDTGRLFPETYDLIDATNKSMALALRCFFRRPKPWRLW